MKTTIDIAEPLLTRAKRLAAEEGTTLRDLVEEGLRLALERRRSGSPFQLLDARVDGRGVQSGIQEGEWATIRALIYEGHGG